MNRVRWYWVKHKPKAVTIAVHRKTCQSRAPSYIQLSKSRFNSPPPALIAQPNISTEPISTVDMASAEDRQRLKKQFQDLPASKHTGGWDNLWQQDFTPWDRKGPSLALKDAVTGNADAFGSPMNGNERRRAFVPGELWDDDGTGRR